MQEGNQEGKQIEEQIEEKQMKAKRIIEENGVRVALMHSDTPLVSDAQSMLDLIATLSYIDDCDRIALQKSAVAEAFFYLGSGVAGEVLQKIVNYRKKLAIFGDFSGYTSKALRDFIYECNSGNAVFFVATQEEAVAHLLRA